MKIRTWFFTILASATFFSVTAQAEKYSFQTASDKFDLIVGPKGGTFGGKSVDISPYQDGLNALNSPLGNDCPPLKGKPDVTVTIGGQTRMVYVAQEVVTDGKTCTTVQGEGLFYIPIHRDFLVGPKKDSIPLKSSLKIFRQGVKILSLKKQGKVWISEAPEQILDWDFIERFQNSLADFSIRLRVQQGIAKDKPKIILQCDGQTYEFYKLTEKMWAMKKPGAKWLAASDDWSSWYDLDPKMLEDRYAGQIEFISDASKDKDSRLSALSKLDASWSPNLRNMYHKILLDENDDPAIQEIAMQRLKRMPAMPTAGVMVKFLETSKNEDLKKEAGVILKLQNPKGPKYNPSGSDQDKAKVLEFWRNWWKQNKESAQADSQYFQNAS